ncbi:MAG: hypothetical protein M1826_004181 [Phylliscum demangeonii]|nr:MAG: hypothetical protein M1826_004181 [Phylliscum demangeonii]
MTLQSRSIPDPEPFGDVPKMPGYLQGLPFHSQMNVLGEEFGYCMCWDRIMRRLSKSEVARQLSQIQKRCAAKVTREWNAQSDMLNPPNPLRHPQRRARDFQDIVYIPPHLVGTSLQQITYNLGVMTGICGCNEREDYEVHQIGRPLSDGEWSERGNAFFDQCREDTAVAWISSAVQGQGVPQGLPAPSLRVIRPRPGFNPDLNWIPHPHGLGRLNIKGLAAAASHVRQKVWDFGTQQEGRLLRGIGETDRLLT